MGEGWGDGGPMFILSPPPPFVLSRQKDPSPLVGEGWGEGGPPRILSRQKDPSPLVGEGWGEGAYPQLTALFTSDSDQRS